jgi:hypothetical protein
MGGAVLAAGTVRRAAGPWSPTIQRFLQHLLAHEVDGVPQPLGTDERGRDVTAYLPGEVPSYPVPAWVWADEVLRDAAVLLRRAHDASTSFDRSGAVWRLPARAPADVVCHNDTAPDNMVFHDRRLVGLIDWDTASPGPRVWDLAYLAYRLVPLGPAAADPGPIADEERQRRLVLLCDAYGGVEVGELVRTVGVRLRELARFTQDRSGGDPELERHGGLYLSDAAWIDDHAEAFV